MLCTAATELGVSALEGSVAPIGRGEHVVEGDRNGAVTATTRTPMQAAKQHGSGHSMAWTDSSKHGLSPGGRPPQRQPRAWQDRAAGRPRCTRVAKVVLNDR